jgi:hypothetical protein
MSEVLCDEEMPPCHNSDALTTLSLSQTGQLKRARPRAVVAGDGGTVGGGAALGASTALFALPAEACSAACCANAARHFAHMIAPFQTKDLAPPGIRSPQ